MNEKWVNSVNAARLPSWYKCRLFEASTGRVWTVQGSFRTGYGEVGKSLGRAVDSIVDNERALESLDASLNDSEAVTTWVKSQLGGFLRLVPARKREAFIVGFAEGRASEL